MARRARLVERQVVMFVLMLATSFVEQQQQVQRIVWVKPRTTAVWDEMVRNLNNDEWKEHFRVKRDTFQLICELLRPKLAKRNTRFRQSISVDKGVAIALWRMATNVEFRTIGALFGVGRSTACLVVHQVAKAIVFLQRQFLKFPTGDALKETIRGNNPLIRPVVCQ